MTWTRVSRLLIAGGMAAAFLLLSAGASAAKKPAPRAPAKKMWVPHDKFSKDCAQCHEPKRWNVLKRGFRYNHFKETGVPLMGVHSTLGCSRCHNDRLSPRAARSKGCVACHQDPHRGSLGNDCARCHGPATWKPNNMAVEHARTRFPLTGAHQATTCARCHPRADAQDFRGASVDCYACHAADYGAAPNHSAGNYDRRCGNCHTTAAWSGGRIDHARMTTATDCYGCHAADYARGPNHTAQTYARTCLQCHNTTSWVSARVDHGTFNAGTNCSQCHAADYQRGPNHIAGNYPTLCGGCHTSYASWGPGTPMNHTALGGRTDCITCHRANYQAAPNHAAQNYPTTCGQCHSGYSSWVGATFSHSALAGRTDCQTCHMDKYQSAQNPNHVSMAFPTTCYNCHRDTNVWQNATLVHNRFPTDHHHSTCLQCHTSGTSTSYNCLNCHRQTDTDEHHKEVSGYSYNSTTCMNCHVGGRVP